MDTNKINLTQARLRRATDDRSWERGMDYFEEGRAEILFDDEGVIKARVAGSQNYKVRLCVEGGKVCGQCSCPIGDEGVFCKHLVAVGLTYLKEDAEDLDGKAPGNKAPSQSRSGRPHVTLEDVRQYLSRQDPARLVEMILRQVEDDDRLRERLLMEVARQGPEGLDVATFRKAIDRATHTGGFVDYRSAHGFSSGIEEVVDAVAKLLKEGHAAKVIGLAEHAIDRCESALGEMDDSDGSMGDVLGRLVEIHHEACLAAKPDSETVARRLFQWELDGQWDTFSGASEMYADVLGAKGLATYRQLAQAMWDKTPALGPGEK